MSVSDVAYLRSRGWSRQAIADHLKCHYFTVVYWSRGKHQPHDVRLVRGLARLVAHQQALDAAAAAQITLEEDVPDEPSPD